MALGVVLVVVNMLIGGNAYVVVAVVAGVVGLGVEVVGGIAVVLLVAVV